MKQIFLFISFVLINYQLFAQNYAFDFSASNTSNIVIGGSDVAPPWTAEMWVYKKATTSYSSVLKGTSGKLDLETWGASQKVGITKYGVNDWAFPTGYVVPVAEWTHLAWVCNGTKTYLYVNGVIKDSLAQVINMPMTTIGNLPDKESPNALLDEIRFWKTAKKGSELLAGMNTTATLTDPNLLAYFYADDQASPAKDISTYKRLCPINNVSYVVNSNINFITNLPVAPTIGTATAGDGTASITFTAPGGTAPITDYTVTSSPGGLTATGTTSPIVVTGLTNGQAYTFTVTANSAGYTSAASTASNSVMPSGTITTSGNIFALSGIKVYRNNNNRIVINGRKDMSIYTVIVCNSLGQKVYQAKLTKTITELNSICQSGAYIISLLNNNKLMSVKVMLQ